MPSRRLGKGRGGRTVELDDGGVGELAAVPDGGDVAGGELVGDRDAVDLVQRGGLAYQY